MTINRKLRGIRDPVDPGYILGRPKNMGRGPAVQLKAPTGLLAPNQTLDVQAGLPASGVTAGSYTNANITVNAKGLVTAAGNGTSGLPALNDGQIWIGNGTNVAVARTPSGDVTVSDTGVTAIGAAKVTEAMQVLADNTTQNATTSAHGYLKKLDGNATHYMGGDGNWSVPAGNGTSGGIPWPVFTTPVNGDFAWVNQGGASVTVNANGGIYLLAPLSATANLRIRKKSAPSTPYVITGAFFIYTVNISYQQAGLCFRNAGSGKIVTFGLDNESGFAGYQIAQWTNATTFSASAFTLADAKAGGGLVWLRIADDGANRLYSYSMDGYNFIQLYSEGRTTFATADEVGFYASELSNTYQCAITLMSWAQT